MENINAFLRELDGDDNLLMAGAIAVMAAVAATDFWLAVVSDD
jgi:hypothetical protein